jgi:hypothetical protein
MARIRSIHSGFFTDGEIQSMSDAAQIVLIGLGTQADDHGAFKWSPVDLKIRLRPASTQPFEPILDELIAFNRVQRVTIGGKDWGLIRNFCASQRPRKVSYSVELTPKMLAYVGFGAPCSELNDGERTPGDPVKGFFNA